VITDSIGATTAKDSLWGRIPNQYILAARFSASGTLSAFYPGHEALSKDGGRSWQLGLVQLQTDEQRAILAQARRGPATALCSDPKVVVPTATLRPDSIRGTPWGLLGPHDSWGCVTVPRGGSLVSGRMARGEKRRHTWFRRPIALTDQPFIDQTYRFGSTMGGNFQPHQGVEFNNADGTPVHAIGDGVVVHSGPAERGALTVAIKHNKQLKADGRRLHLFSVYYHNSKLLVPVGQRVKAGDVIALVGNTGRATNDHLHLEVHASPFDSTRLIVDSAVRYPPHSTNPELWIEPLLGTGMIAGQVWDSARKPVYQARIYGLVKPEPQETPFSFIETYGPRNHSDPVYEEHFAISDVPPGEYVLGVEIGGTRIFRSARVEAGKLTWVVFSLPPSPRP
jgi:murein DD-endopeptidase MepM/ murein hydrolase activator NlpD